MNPRYPVRPFLAVFTAVLAVSPFGAILGAVPSAGLGLPGGPPSGSGFISPNGTVLQLSMSGLTGWESLGLTGEVYTDALSVAATNVRITPYTVVILVHQYQVDYETETIVANGTSTTESFPVEVNDVWENYSFTVAARSSLGYGFSVPDAPVVEQLAIWIDGLHFQFAHHTLPALAIFGTLSVGAVEIIVIGVLFLACILVLALVPVARSVQAKGQRWAPRPKMALWIALTVIIGGPTVVEFWAPLDFALNAWVYVLIPVAFGVPMFFWLLRFFNSADIREILKAYDPEKTLLLKFVRWERLFCEVNGDLILVWECWRGWLYSLLGHPIKVHRANAAGDQVEGPPFAGQVLYEEHKRRPQGAGAPFALVGARKFEPGWLYFVDSDRVIDVVPPHFVFTRLETLAGPPGPDGKPTKVQKRRFSPHIEDGKATLHLAGIHWQHVVAVALEWVRAERLARALEIEGLKNTVLRREIETRANALAETLMDAFARMMGRPNRVMTHEEAREEIAAWGNTFDPLLGGRRRGRNEDQR